MKSPPNKVTFEVSPEMTRLDVKNYLEKIYQVPVLSVNTKIVSGRTDYFRHNNAFRELYKEPDIKYAYVTLVGTLYFIKEKIIHNNFDFFFSPKMQSLSILM